VTEASFRLEQGERVLGRADLTIAGFVPPAWSMPSWLVPMLAARSYRFAEDHTRIYDPQGGHSRASLVLNYATRTPRRDSPLPGRTAEPPRMRRPSFRRALPFTRPTFTTEPSETSSIDSSPASRATSSRRRPTCLATFETRAATIRELERTHCFPSYPSSRYHLSPRTDSTFDLLVNLHRARVQHARSTLDGVHRAH
jgi:hypothetical protein